MIQSVQHISFQIIVLDNQSIDSTVEIVRSQFPDVQLLRPEDNLGFARGVNEAARYANANYILLLNPDTLIIGNAIDNAVDFANENPEYGVYGGRTLKSDLSLEPSSCWNLPSLWSCFTFATGLSSLFKHTRAFDPESLSNWERDSVKEVGVITGCFLLIKQVSWKLLNGFDERYWMYGEDADFAIRARAQGFRPVICPDAELIHEVGGSSKNREAKVILMLKGKATLMLSHWGKYQGKLGVCLLLVGVLLRSVLSSNKLLSESQQLNRWQFAWENRKEWVVGY